MKPKTKRQAGAASESKARPTPKKTARRTSTKKATKKAASSKDAPENDESDGRHVQTPAFRLHPDEEARLIQQAQQRLQQHADRMAARGSGKSVRSVRSHRLGGRPAVKGWQETFLAALRECPSVKAAQLAANIGRSTVYEHRDDDPDFKAAWDDALAEGIDAMEGEAMRRAMHGTEDIDFHEDGSIKKIKVNYSDGLLTTLLKAHRPEKYKDALDVGGEVKFIPLDELSARVRAIKGQ